MVRLRKVFGANVEARGTQLVPGEKYDRSLRVLTPSSLKQMKEARDHFFRWLREKEHWDKDEIAKFAQFGAQHPSVNVLKQWIRFWAADSTGMLSEKAVQATVIAKWKCLSSWLKRTTGQAVNKAVGDELLNFIKNELKVLEGIQDIGRPKNKVDAIDYSQFMEQIWCYDAFSTLFGRNLLQTALTIQMLTMGGCHRPGAIMSTCHDPGFGLCWKHIHLFADRRPGSGEVYLRVKFRADHMKGEKSLKKFVETVFSEQPRFYDCTVLSVIALAFAADAFADLSTYEELFAKAPQPDSILTIPWKAEMIDEYIMQAPKRPRNPWTYGTFRHIFQAMCFRAGYKHRISLYNIRRGVANNLAKQVPSTILRQAMGHVKDSTYLEYYQSQTMEIDFEGLWLRGRQGENVDFASVRRVERGTRPPTTLPNAVVQAIETKTEHLASKERYAAREASKKRAWSIFLKQWHMRHDSSYQLWERSSTLIPDSCELRGDLRDPTVISDLKRAIFTLDHQFVKNTFFADTFNMRDNNFQMLKLIVGILQEPKQDTPIYFYPDSQPARRFLHSGIEYVCQFCHEDLTE
ncbi:hypothetical protein EG328_009838 [Venturia inaequalis]|uniref:Uncharacterized protein n=1 Tax=Venturia inaequalis TaxID=5025 RepID=A0A8H3U9E7_VENIN|nr:hypothetical protein EG328_009838 [Venturia inaequalis]